MMLAKLATFLLVLPVSALGCGSSIAEEPASTGAGSQSKLPDIQIWKGGKNGSSIHASMSCGPGDTDTVTHGDDDTASLHFVPDPVIPGLCVTFLFAQPIDLRSYAGGAVRFSIRSAVDYEVRLGSPKNMAGGLTGSSAAKLSELGMTPDGSAFQAAVVPIAKLHKVDPAKYTDVDLAKVQSVGIESQGPVKDLWIENVRVTAD
jgi:hypothetical protein